MVDMVRVEQQVILPLDTLVVVILVSKVDRVDY